MRKISILSITVVLMTALSCGEEVLEKANRNNQTTATYFKTESEISAALTGVYAILQSNNLGGREWFFLNDLRSDEMATGGSQLETPRNQLLIGTHDPGNSVLSSVWTGEYRVILRANAVIQYAPEIEGSQLTSRFIAEAKFIRAWAYYQLYALWGAVPIYTEFATTLDGAKPKATLAEVKAQIETDLNDAIAGLPESYSGNDLGRVTKIAAQALLAKVYMFDAEYAKAMPLLQAIIAYGEGAFGGNPLMDNYYDNFTEEAEYNKESIWELSYNSGGNYNWDADGNGAGANEAWMRSQEYSAIGWRNLIPSDKILAEFEPNDPRFKDNFYVTGDKYGDPAAQKSLTDGDQRGNGSILNGAPMKVSWKKYSVMYKLDPGGYYDKIGMNHRLLRYADIYLLMAECENEIGSAANAVTYLNKTRKRPSVNMPEYPTAKYPTGSKDQIMAAIMHERMVELAGEEVRNVDILRWRKAGKFQTDPISYFQANKYELLPIPLQELDANINIEQADQNPGY
jgi:hypothetical protein